ncbi:probable DNA repair protein complementing XP-C cells homolog [Coccomyxa sp. Obi]|nr:probable DNA repair protein complementing XP-C cells homolog [Coccomyxa sp. Obi]
MDETLGLYPAGGKGEGREAQDEKRGPLTREERMMQAWLKYYKRVANKEKAELARSLHKTNLLCLLAHGLLLDQAANDPLVQAMALSVADTSALPAVDAKGGIKSSSLQPIATWYSSVFRQLSTAEAAQKGDKGKAGGVEAVAERLQQVAAQKEGSTEELVALYVAIMRSLGLLARTIRALDVLPLKPSRSEGRGRVRGGQPVRHKPASAKPASAPRAPRESRSPKRRRPSASTDEAHQVEGADGDKEAEESGGTRGRGRGRGSAGGRRRASAAKEDTAEDNGMAEQVEADGQEEGQSGRKGGKSRAGRGRGRGKSKGQDTDDEKVSLSITEDEGDKKQAAASLEQQKKRKGDLEYENQVAMAMQASLAAAAAAGPSAALVKTGAIPNSAAGRAVDAKAIMAMQQSLAPSTSPAQQGLPKNNSPTQGQLAGSMWARSRRGLDGHCWAEVYCGSAESGSWVHVDPLTGTVDRAQDVEKGCVREAPMAYVVAFSGNTAKDVTQRYVRSFRAVEKLRDEQWWQETLQPLRPQLASSAHRGASSLPAGRKAQPLPASKGSQRVLDMVSAREDAELQQKFSSELADIPNTIPAFKSHPRYVLERHIGRYQALKPGTTKLGLHRGEAFYPRGALQDLHTAEIWQRKGRQVIDSELAKPAKTITRRGAKDDHKAASTPEEVAEAFKDDDEDDDPFKPTTPKTPASKETNLFGYWQTVEWIPPQAKDGIVPKNERGNVMCPPLAHALPLGTVHLSDMPRVSLVCKALGIDYAVAMTGFETRGGQSVPVFDGVVVCEEHAQAVVDKYWAAERERQEKAENKAIAAAENNWRNLLRSIFTRIKVQGDYSAANGDANGTVIDDDPECAGIDNGDPVVVDDSDEEQPAERPPPPKSGAAAAAALAAAEADVAARAVARRTWKDPVAAAREQAGTCINSAASSRATESLQAAGTNGHAARRHAKSSRPAEAVQAGEAEPSEAMAGGSGAVLETVKAGKGLVQGDEGGQGAANGNGAMTRKRTRSGIFVDCEEI